MAEAPIYVDGLDRSLPAFPRHPAPLTAATRSSMISSWPVQNLAASTLTIATFYRWRNRLKNSTDIAVDGAGLIYLTGSDLVQWTSPLHLVPSIRTHKPRSILGCLCCQVERRPVLSLCLRHLPGRRLLRMARVRCRCDSTGAVYITGYTRSDDFPITPNAFDRSHNGNDDTFVVQSLNVRVATTLSYTTFLGGSGYEFGNASHRLARHVPISVTGITRSTDFPTTAQCHRS